MRNFVSILSSHSVSPKPVKVTEVSLHSTSPRRDFVCSFVRNRENQLMNLRLTPKLVANYVSRSQSQQIHICLTLQQISSIQHLPSFTSLTVSGSSFPPLAQSLSFIKASAQLFLVSPGEKIA